MFCSVRYTYILRSVLHKYRNFENFKTNDISPPSWWTTDNCFIIVIFAAGHLQTFTDQVSRARKVPAVFAGKVCDKHGVSTNRPLDGKFVTFTEELRFLQTSRP